MKYYLAAFQLENLFNARCHLLSEVNQNATAEILKTMIYFTSQECKSWIPWLENLENVMAYLFEQQNEVQHLNDLIKVQEELASITSREDANHCMWLNDLGISLRD